LEPRRPTEGGGRARHLLNIASGDNCQVEVLKPGEGQRIIAACAARGSTLRGYRRSADGVRERLGTVIDVLGFRDLVKADARGDTVLKVSRELRRYGTEDLFGEGEAHKAAYVHFSDSVVRVIRLTGGEAWQTDKAAVLHELESLIYIQGELAAMEVLIRGGVAAGDVYADNSGVFGPAFIEAHERIHDANCSNRLGCPD
jgi:hypothetical protein